MPFGTEDNPMIVKVASDDSLLGGHGLSSNVTTSELGIGAGYVPGVIDPNGRLYADLSTATAKAGLEKFRLHDLRHTHATLLLGAGVPVNAVAQRLGHSTPVMTLSVYGHVLKRSEEQAVDISGAILKTVLA